MLSCSKNEAQYKCPKCTIPYCSLNCFKDGKHVKCTEKFYEEQVKSQLTAEKVSEVSDEREKMIEILKRLETLSASASGSDEEDQQDKQDDLDKFLNLDINSLSCEEIEKLLGPKHLENLEELIKNGVSTEWLAVLDEKSTDTDNNNYAPWFTRFKPSLVILNEDLPAFVPKLIENVPKLKLAKVSDFLWNNLMEILVIYSFLYKQFPVDDFEDSEVVKGEILPCFFELSSVMNSSSSSTGTGTGSGNNKNNTAAPFYYQSAMEAIESAQSAMFMNSPVSGEDVKETEIVVFEGVKLILSHPKMILLTLSDIYSWLLQSSKDKEDTNCFFAQKKIFFFYAWIEREVESNKLSMDEILKTLILILDNKM